MQFAVCVIPNAVEQGFQALDMILAKDRSQLDAYYLQGQAYLAQHKTSA